MDTNKLKELWMNSDHFKTIKENIELYQQVSDANDIRDLKEILYILIDKCLPCSVGEWQAVREVLEGCESDH